MQTTDVVERAQLRYDLPDFRPGDTVKVHVRVFEGSRSRIQLFQGVCIRLQGSGVGRTFTVRKISFGVGVERTFPLHTPIIEKVEVVTRGDVRRAVGRLVRVREREVDGDVHDGRRGDEQRCGAEAHAASRCR